MTPRNLFNVVLKILGILFLKQTLELASQIFQLVPFFENSDSLSAAILTSASLVLMIAIDLLFIYLLIFKSSYIINKLKLTSGFDREIVTVDANRKTILSIAIIVIGGLILVDAIPGILRLLYQYYLSAQISHGMAKSDTTYFIIYGSKILIGLLLMGEQRRIVGIIERKSKNMTIDNEA